MSEAYLGLLGVIIGGAITISSERLRAGYQVKQISKEYKIRATERRNDFQRENLIALQESFAHWIRAQGKCMIHDRQQLKESGILTQLPEDISNELFETSRNFKLQINRVLDDELRNLLFETHAYANRVSIARIVKENNYNIDDVDQDNAQLIVWVEKVENSIGKLLRKYL